MTELEARTVRIHEVILGQGSDPTRFNHIRSGFRVTGQLPNGLQVCRIHSSYLNGEPLESWTLRWDQLAGFTLLPQGTQLPLF